LVTAALGLGCAAVPWAPSAGDVPSTPSTRWPVPPALAQPLPAEAPPEAPPQDVDLAKLIDYVLAHNPATKVAWAQARAAAAALGSKRAAYYPSFDLAGQVGYTKQSGGGRVPFEGKSIGPSVSMSWLLLDLGGRSGDVGEARSLLDAANLAQDTAILQTLFGVEQAYYGFLSSKALLRAEEATVEDAQKNYDAAQARRAAGVATIADALQAQTQRSQAELNLQSAQGQVEIARGGLANAAGLPPTTAFQLPELPDTLPLEEAKAKVEVLLAAAQAQRPDLARARALVAAAQQHESSVGARALPQLALTGSAGRTFYLGSSADPGDAYSIQAVLKFPLFDGFKSRYDKEQAQAETQVAQAQVEGLARQVALEVWSSYQSAQTAAKRVKAARDLLASATQSEQVAQGRYHEGAGSVLDLLAAQSALASARAQDVQARADWLVAMAALARDTGTLDVAPKGDGR
jgi:outer membrane protein TolC